MADYNENHIWVGRGNDNCTDPKFLRNQISTTIEDLNVERFKFETFDQKKEIRYHNDSAFIRKKTFFKKTVCHTLTIPRNIVKLGIEKLTVNLKSMSTLKVILHQQGLLFSDMPDSSPFVEISPPITAAGYGVPIGKLDLIF